MSNSTIEFWDVDGQSLNTFAFNITSIGGDRLAPPPLRGANLAIPYAPGRRFLPKIVDSRTITLGFWVQGTDEDGFVPTNGAQAAQFDTNFRKLRALLWQPDREFILTKRFYVNGVLKTASAKAQFASGLIPSMTGRARGIFTVDILLADPFFYSDYVVTTLVNGAQNVTIDGDYSTHAILFTINGSRTNIKVKNNTNNIDVTYQSALNSGDKADLDVLAYTSTTTPSGVAAYSTPGLIRHTGDPFWFELAPGVNNITLSSDSGIGVVTMSSKAAWL